MPSSRADTGIQETWSSVLSEPLAGYHLWHAARADLLRRMGRSDEALASYQRAYALAGNEAERRFLGRRVAELTVES